MANVTIARYLTAQCVQGSADSFVQDAITTGLVPADGFAFKLTRMVYDVNPLPLVANCDRTFSLTRDTKTAVCKYDDPDTLFMQMDVARLVTSGGFIAPASGMIDFPDGIYVVEPTIYLQLDSSTTSLTMTMNARFYYEEVKLSEVEILRLLNNI